MNNVSFDSKGVSLIGVIFVMVLFSIFGIVGISLVTNTVRESYNSLKSNQALFIAEAGADYVLETQLRDEGDDDGDWSDNSNVEKTFPPDSSSERKFIAEYIKSTPSTATILFTGKIPVTGEKEDITRKIKMDFSKLPLPGGYLIYIEGLANTKEMEDTTIEGEIKENADNVPTLSMDYSYYESIADHTVYGDKTFDSGTYSGIWYVEGDVTVAEAADVTFNGSIVSTGTFKKKEGDEGLIINPDSGDPAIIAGGDINMKEPENVDISGLIYSGGCVNLKEPEGITIDGVIYAVNDVNMKEIENLDFTGIILAHGNVNLKEAEESLLTADDSLLPSGLKSDKIYSDNWNEVY